SRGTGDVLHGRVDVPVAVEKVGRRGDDVAAPLVGRQVASLLPVPGGVGLVHGLFLLDGAVLGAQGPSPVPTGAVVGRRGSPPWTGPPSHPAGQRRARMPRRRAQGIPRRARGAARTGGRGLVEDYQHLSTARSVDVPAGRGRDASAEATRPGAASTRDRGPGRSPDRPVLPRRVPGRRGQGLDAAPTTAPHRRNRPGDRVTPGGCRRTRPVDR